MVRGEAGERAHEFMGIEWGVICHHERRHAIGCDEVHVRRSREAVAWLGRLPPYAGRNLMPSSGGAKYARLPRRFDALARADGQIRKRWRSRDEATQKFDPAFADHRSAGIDVRCRVPIADLDSAQTRSSGQKVCPAYLKKIEMVGLGFTRKAAGQNERRSKAVGRQCFEARRSAAIREIDSRTAVQRIEEVSVTGADAAPNVSKQQSAALIGSGGGERLGLRGPLPASGGINVSPLRERSADLQTIAREPAKLI